MKQQEHIMQEQAAIRLRPIISYPREAKVGERYLFTIDVQLAEDSPWPYQEEEFEISFILETAPFFTHEPLGKHEPGLVLHRYGGTYGAAEYLLTASQQIVAPGGIKVTLLNGWGLPIAQLELECEVKEDGQDEARRATRPTKQVQHPAQSPELPKVEQRDAVLDDHQQQELVAKQLAMVGWEVWSVDMLATLGPNKQLQVPRGFIALRGYRSVEDDYLLIIDRVIIGIVKVHVGGEQLPDKTENIALPGFIVEISNLKFEDSFLVKTEIENEFPFVYHTTGYSTIFASYLELSGYFRSVYTFYQPSTFGSWLNELRNLSLSNFRAHLSMLPALEQGDLFDYQYEALRQIDQSLSGGYSRTLIQLETGRGKTHIATRYIYRLLEDAKAMHIFYVVDIPVTKQYALDAFKTYIIESTSVFDEVLFTDHYKIEIIGNEKLDSSVHVYIGTLEDLYTLYASGREGQNLPAPISNNSSIYTTTSVKDYNIDLPIEYFDAIFLAESEHIDYQFWQPVLDYFDTFYIGIAASLSDEVLRFFNTHLVYPTVASNEETRDKQDTISYTARQKQFSTSIRRVRNLLHNDAGLYGDADLLTQIIWLLLLKYLDDFELVQTELLGDDYTPIIDKNYRWRDWAANKDTAYQRSGEELIAFVNGHLIPYLSQLSGSTNRDLRSIIGTVFQSIHNQVRSGYILREVIDNLNTIQFNSNDDFHAISLFYEALLKELLTSKATAGEFYTPRPLIKFIIDRLQPQLGETMLDPACGTAGFLTETYEQLIGQVRTPEQRQQLQDHLIGVEKRSIPYLLALMNMLLHGIEAPNIQENNALIINISQLQDEDYVDIIATNPPFNGKEEPDIHYRSSSRYMPTTDANLLFIQLIMNSLKRPGGRCGIIMTNSFLYKKGIASQIKHDLLTYFNLHTIVRLPPGVFSAYTGIPTNILFFEANEYLNSLGGGSCTKEVWYYELPLPKGQRSYTKAKPIQFEAFRECLLWWEHREENEHAWKVLVEELFANDCNLDVKRGSHPSG